MNAGALSISIRMAIKRLIYIAILFMMVLIKLDIKRAKGGGNPSFILKSTIPQVTMGIKF
jgi:hypothetical protein